MEKKWLLLFWLSFVAHAATNWEIIKAAHKILSTDNLLFALKKGGSLICKSNATQLTGCIKNKQKMRPCREYASISGVSRNDLAVVWMTVG